MAAMDSWNRFQAAWNHLQIQEIKAEWRQQGEAPRGASVNNGFRLGYKASEKEPANADYRFMLARLHAWHQQSLKRKPAKTEAETRKVIENLKGALARRPTWFEAWIALALVKFQSGRADHELKVALEKAMETGQYQTPVHHGAAFVGLRVWEDLGPGLQERVSETVRLALDNRAVRGFVVEQIVLTRRWSPFGDKLAADPELMRLVESYQRKREQAL